MTIRAVVCSLLLTLGGAAHAADAADLLAGALAIDTEPDFGRFSGRLAL